VLAGEEGGDGERETSHLVFLTGYYKQAQEAFKALSYRERLALRPS
jgi:hypothetical protein